MSRKRKVMIEDPDWIEFTKKQKKFNELIEAAEGQTKDPEQAVKEASELDCYIQKWDVDDMFKFYLSQTTTPETRGSIASLLLAQKAHQDMGRILRQRIENEVVQHSAALFCVGFCGAKLVNRVERVAVIVAWHPGADTVRLETQIRKQYFGFADAQRFLCQGQQFSYNQNPEMVFDPDVHCKNDEERAEAAGNGPEPANACLWWCETTTNEFYSKPGRRYCRVEEERHACEWTASVVESPKVDHVDQKEIQTIFDWPFPTRADVAKSLMMILQCQTKPGPDLWSNQTFKCACGHY